MSDKAPQTSTVMAPSMAEGYVNRTANQPIFNVRRPLWRSDDDQSVLMSDSHAKLRQDILQRDNYTCRYCGFKSARYQELHQLDSDPENCTKENLVTACNLCRQVFHLGACAMKGSGFLTVVPELTQTEVNHIARAIYVNEFLGGQDIKDKLESLTSIFRYRGSDTLKQVFDGEVLTVLTLAETLASKSLLTDEEFANRAETFSAFRLFPTKNAFEVGQLEYYAANNKSLFAIDNWTALTEQLVAQAS